MALRYFWPGFVFFLSSVIVPVPLMAGEPTEKIRETTDKILAIVSDQALKAPDKTKERKRLVREVVDERFDWEEMSRRTLARHWARRTEEEKKEFVSLLGKLLERTYMDRVGDYSGEKVLYGRESVDGDYGVVRIKIVTRKETEIPVMYRIKKKAGDWFVYDISVEGVSLVNNYRSQFNSIIVRSSYKDLVKKLRAKVKEN